MTLQAKSQMIVRDLLYYDRRELITLNLFWIGFIIYTVSWTLSKSTQVNFVICQLFQFLGILIFVPACISLIKFRFSNEYQKILFVLFIFWSALTFLRGLELNKDALKTIIFDPWFGGFLYFAPVIMLFPVKLIYIKKIFDVIVILGVFYVIYDILFISNLMEPDGENVLSREIVEYFSKTLSVTAAFILLTYTYHSRPKLFYALCLLLLTIFFAMVRARRGLLIMSVGPLFFLYFLYFHNVKKKTVLITVSIVVGLITLSVVTFLTSQGSFSFFELLAERGAEDTRSNVEETFFYDMEGIDYIIGRGMNGEYYSPTVGSGNYRGTIETDYLNIILKGGSISLVLLLLIIVPAGFLGVFSSKNTLSKAGGIWIFLWLINTYPSTVQVFTLNYLIVWLAVGWCYSRTFRNIPEHILQFYFSPSKAQDKLLILAKKNHNENSHNN